MNIGSVHHNNLSSRAANSRAAYSRATHPATTKNIPGNAGEIRRASSTTTASRESDRLLPIDRIPATRNNLDSKHQNDAAYQVFVQTSDQVSQQERSGRYSSEGERAIAFYMITETISSAGSQGELIGIDTYA